MKIRHVMGPIALAAWMIAACAPAADDGVKDQRKLIEVLQSNAPAAEKAITCKRLAIYGGREAVPALAPLLADEKLSSWARIALEAIPDPAADEALRQSLDKVQGRLLVGVINSIGVRRDAKAAEALAPRLKDADVEVASAAAVALGRIGNAAALEPALAGGLPAVRSAVAEGCILCEKCLADGKPEEAVKLYDAVRKADVPKQRLLEATRGAILARQSAGVPLLAEQLKSADNAFFALGLSTARELKGPEVAAAVVAALGQAPVERRALLVKVLTDHSDEGALAALFQVAKSGPEKLRIVAIGELGRVGNVAAVPMLLEAAVEARPEVSQAAIAALAELPGKEVSDELSARLQTADGKIRLALIRIVGQRRIETTVPELLKAVDAADVQVRCAALTALGQTISQGDLPILIARVVNPGSREETKAAQDALMVACTRMADREACARSLADAMAKVPLAAQCKILEVLGAMGGARALQTLGTAARDTRPAMKDAATRLLGGWLSADAAGPLLDIAKNDPDARYQVRALRGYIRIARQLQLPADTKLAMFRTAMEVAKRNEEKQIALDILTRIPSVATLNLAVSYVGQPALKDSAGDAAVKIAAKLPRQESKAVAEAMQKVAEAGVSGTLGNRARQLLGQAKAGSN